jgi:N-methylhydantoinase A
MIRVGVDVGGTFTDVILEQQLSGKADNTITVTKVPSTPQDPSEGVIKGILQVCEQAGISPSEIVRLLQPIWSSSVMALGSE